MAKGKGATAVQEQDEELPGMPELPESHKAAKALLKLRDKKANAIEKLDAEIEVAQQKVLDAMVAENVDHIEVNAVPIKRVHTDAFESIKVLPPKKRKKKADEEEAEQ